MIQRAGIALGRLAYGAEFSITTINRDPGPTLLPPTRHKLVDGHTVDDIVNSFHDAVGFDAKDRPNGFALSLPISASDEQWRAFYVASHRRSVDHFEAWANGYAKSAPEKKKNVNILFVDLTPGQVASKLVNGYLSNQGWTDCFNRGYTDLDEDVDSLSTDDLYDKLIHSRVVERRQLHLVGILRPEGAFPEVSATYLESKLLNVPVKWVTLDDISYGAAILMDRKFTSSKATSPSLPAISNATKIPTGIALANGSVVTVFPKGEAIPTTRSFIFTTFQDDQATATAQLCLGTVPCAKVTLEGLTSRTRGQAAIKVTLDIQKAWDATLSMEEIGTGLRTTMPLMTVFDLWKPITDADKAERERADEQLEMAFGKDGVVGELPE
jgi:hypothetical protein